MKTMSDPANASLLFKLLPMSSWNIIIENKKVPFSDLDNQDGFMHLSTHDQYMQTANLHYTDYKEVICLLMRKDRLLGELKWEAAKKRDNALFPHLYGEAPMEAIEKVHILKRQADNSFLDQGVSENYTL